MILIEINPLFDDFQFNFLLFFILLMLAYLLSRMLQFKSFTSVIALHAIFIFICAIAELIDYMYLIFAIIEIAILLKIGGSQNESN